MNHYDGPAFYRRFLQKPNQNNNHDSYSNNKMTNSNRIESVNGAKTSQVSNFRNDGENMIAKMTNDFKPKGNYARKVNHHNNYLNESKLGHYYLKLVKQLTDNYDDRILFDDGLDTRANSDLIQFDDADETPASMATSQAPIERHADHSKHAFETAVASHNAKPTSDEAYHQSMQSHQSSDAVDGEASLSGDSTDIGAKKHTERFHSDYESVGTSEASYENDIEAHSANESMSTVSSEADHEHSSISATSITQSSSSVGSKTENTPTPEVKQPKHGLGHSLSSILGNENDAQKDVEFFKNEPLVSSSQSNDMQSIATDDAQVSAEGEQNNGQSATDKQHETLSSGTEYNKGYQFPAFTLLNEPHRDDDEDLDDWIIKQSEILERTLHAFHVKAEVVDWTNGPTVTQFQVKLALGVKVSKITNLNDDLKMALAAKDIRIEAPIPGQTTVGVEIPNPKPRPVMLSEVLDDNKFQTTHSPLTIALGVDLTGKPQVTDISKMPHGLIAGATGSGKSVFINSLLVSLLYKATPAQLRLLLIDPKAVELAPYNNIPHLLAPVISEPNEASAALKWAVKEMDERYEKLAAGGARNIEQFNEKAVENDQPQMKMPYIVIIIDELADLMMVASTEVQDYIVRITQKARAAGIHLIVATQRPSVDIVTGTIKNNIPTRIAFMVSSQVDSRTIIDTAGAERLLGKGDMLYLGNGKSQPTRIQGTFVTNDEIERVTSEVRTQGTPKYAFNPKSLLKKVNMVQQQDAIMPEVLAYIAKEKSVSTSKLQRVFSIGYNRAASLIDDLEQQNYISGQHGSKPREVYLTEEDYKKLNL